MEPYAPPPPDPHAIQRAGEHLNLLSVFHFVAGGLGILFSILLIFLIVMFDQVFDPDALLAPGAKFEVRINDQVVEGKAAQEHLRHQLEQSQRIMRALLPAILVGGLVASALVIFSGLQLRRRRGKLFSQIIAALLCLQVPLGTILGIFTFIVLSGPGALALYGERAAPR